MKEKKDQKKPGKWQSTQYSNLIRNSSSGTYYARFRVCGKLIWKTLKTDKITVAQMRLSDLEREERRKAEKGQLVAKGRVTFEAALQAYRENGFRPATPRNRKDAQALKPAALAYYEQRASALLKSWPELGAMEINKITERDCIAWAKRAREEMGATTFNHTLGVLRNTIDYGIKIGARYDNPARGVMRESESPKTLELPSGEKFQEFLAALEGNGSGHLRHSANLVRFLAFGGFRKTEAAHVTWADCDFEKKQITVRGHPETGLKGRRPGEFRVVPMIPEMVSLLEGLRAERNGVQPPDRVMKVGECKKSMDRAAKQVGIAHMSHHDLRHLFATRCIESGVDIPTVARWLGHRDGGALAMKVYGHLRDHHSAIMAEKVKFSVAGSTPKNGKPESSPQLPKVDAVAAQP